MPASTEPAFGQVWRYRLLDGQFTRWMLLAPDSSRAADNGWICLFIPKAKGTKTIVDSMAGLPGRGRYIDPNWERVE